MDLVSFQQGSYANKWILPLDFVALGNKKYAPSCDGLA